MQNQIPTFACVLKSGGDYLPEHVIVLAKQIKKFTTIPYRFVCYTDCKIPGIHTIPLLKAYPGWWSVPEVFRHRGPTVIMGIDTVIQGSLDSLFQLALDSSPQDFWMIRAFNIRNKYASGIMVYNGDWSYIWDSFDYEAAITKFAKGGEQDHTKDCLRRRGITPRIIQNKISGIYSYKHHCKKRIPNDCRVMLFHGKPRPFEVPRIWEKLIDQDLGEAKEIWPDSTVFILGGGPSLADMNLKLLDGQNIIGVNQAFKITDCFVPVCYSGDRRWYHWNVNRLTEYRGVLYTSYPHFVPNPKVPTINLGRVSMKGISTKSRNSIAWNQNSGASAVNLAYWLGARRVVLLGFDMDHKGGKFNWHTDYPTIKRRSNGRWPNPYPKFLECWRQIAIDAKNIGLEIFNATPGSKLNIFHKKDFTEFLP